MKLCASLIASGVLLGMLACSKRRAPVPAPPEQSLPTAPRPPSAAPSPPPVVRKPGPLPKLMSNRVIAELPKHFDPVGPHVGIIAGKGCDIWDLEVGAYAGNTAAKLCTEWDKRWHPERSHDGKWVARVKRGVLTIQPELKQPEPEPAKVTLTDKALRCSDAAQVRFSPDDTQVAVRCPGTLEFVVVDWKGQPARIAARLKPEEGMEISGTTPKKYRLSDALKMTEWAWGPAGIVSAGILGGDSFLVVWWPALDKPPSARTIGDDYLEVDEEEKPADTYVLDPGGRAVFLIKKRSTDGVWSEVFSPRTGALLPDVMGPIDHKEFEGESVVSLGKGHWLPGPHPVWETLEETTYDIPGESSKWKAYRIYTGPGARGQRTEDLPREPPRYRVVQADGKTIVRAKGRPPDGPLPAACRKQACDPSGRFIGVDTNTLRRSADDVTLNFKDNGCLQTGQGVFDCSPEKQPEKPQELAELIGQGCVAVPGGLLDCRARYAKALVFRGGDDPLQSPLFRGDRILKWLHHPGLVDDFLDGKAVALPADSAGFPPAGAGP